jgi:hypothetical protein
MGNTEGSRGNLRHSGNSDVIGYYVVKQIL